MKYLRDEVLLYTVKYFSFKCTPPTWLFTAITFFALCIIQETTVVQIIMPISFYHGGGWSAAQYYGYSGDYCQNGVGNVVFKMSEFTWREWVYIASFFCI